MKSPFDQAHKDFLDRNGFSGEYSVKLLKGGKNNLVYKVDCDARSVVLKEYFRHSGDPRDRGGTEHRFSLFAWNCGLRTIPQVLAYESASGLALYEFVDGSSVEPSQVDSEFVDQCLEFLLHLNKCKNSLKAPELHNASEACFSIAEHLNCVEARVEKLREAASESWQPEAVSELILERLVPSWEAAIAEVYTSCQQLDLNPELIVDPEDRFISPSDFGFHNALVRKDATLCFYDFEYAGWDDCAKIICDFFLQPSVPVPMKYFDHFVQVLLAEFQNSSLHANRAAVLLPVYRIKWCCIVLNDFLPVGRERRLFSLGESEKGRRIQNQLKLASRYLTQPERSHI